MFHFTSRCHCDLLAQNVYHPNLMEGMRAILLKSLSLWYKPILLWHEDKEAYQGWRECVSPLAQRARWVSVDLVALCYLGWQDLEGGWGCMEGIPGGQYTAFLLPHGQEEQRDRKQSQNHGEAVNRACWWARHSLAMPRNNWEGICKGWMFCIGGGWGGSQNQWKWDSHKAFRAPLLGLGLLRQPHAVLDPAFTLKAAAARYKESWPTRKDSCDLYTFLPTHPNILLL